MSIVCFFTLPTVLVAQQSINSIASDVLSRFSGLSNKSGPDTTAPRPLDEDSILVKYRLRNDVVMRNLDSSVDDINKDLSDFPMYVNLGNVGSATKPAYFDIDKKINFRTNVTPYDAYLWNTNNIPFFQEDKPLTKLGFTTGGTQEQHYFARHSRNFTPTWNMAIGFRLTSSEGKYKNVKTNIANSFINTNYVSRNERFRIQGAWVFNQADIQENGGMNFSNLEETQLAFDLRTFSNRKLLPIRLGQEAPDRTNFFGDFVGTGRRLNKQNFFTTLSYDFGITTETETVNRVALDEETKAILASISDSTREEVITLLENKGLNIDLSDSSQINIDSANMNFVVRSFTPKFRLIFNYEYESIMHNFTDGYVDSSQYKLDYPNIDFSEYLTTSTSSDGSNQSMLMVQDVINVHEATLGGLYFLKNQRTDNYIQLYTTAILYDITAHNNFSDLDIIAGSRIKLGLWKDNIKADIKAKLTILGWHQGDNFIDANFSMRIPKIRSSLKFGLYTGSRSEPFHFSSQSNFYFLDDQPSWNKEYTLHTFAALDLEFIRTQFKINNFLFSDKFYFESLYAPKQLSGALNINQLSLHNHIKFLKFMHYTSDLWFQTSSSDLLPIPTWVTRQRLYIGGLAFGKQDVAMGVEFLIVPRFKPQGYAPIVSDWYYQQKETQPTTYNAAFFLNFRIRGFYFYIRLQQLNTVSIEYNDGGFRYPEKNNSTFVLNHYYPGFNMRFGFFWNLIN